MWHKRGATFCEKIHITAPTETKIFLRLAPIGARRTGILVGEPPPQYTVMPSSINDVRCAPMSAFLLQDPAPWIALQSMDGSGELSY